MFKLSYLRLAMRILLFTAGAIYAFIQSPFYPKLGQTGPVTLYSLFLLFIDMEIGFLVPFYILSSVDHQWLLDIGSYPYAYQPVHNFGPKGFALQLVLYETFHTSITAKAVHGLVIPLQQFCWIYLVANTCAAPAQIVLVILLLAQAISYRDTLLTITILLTQIAFYTAGAILNTYTASGNAVETIKIVLFLATLFMMLSHSEEPLPPSAEGTKAFGEIGHSAYMSAPKVLLVLRLLVVGFTSELAAGNPGRLYNIAVYKAMWRVSGYKSRGLISVTEAKERGREVQKGGWAADELTRDLGQE